MKIYIEKYSKDSTRTDGKTLFCNRLGKELESRGIQITGNIETSTDVSINVVRPRHQKSRIKLLRLDGVYFDTRLDYRRKNSVIAEGLHNSDAVVYQSEFAKSMCDKYLGKFSGSSRVILNGADPNFYLNVVPAKVECEKVFLAVSRWRKFKRLEDIIESFLLANIRDSILYVVGDTRKSGVDKEKHYYKDSRIRFLGHIQQEKLASYLKAAVALIYISWFDACPNSVVEAVAARTPVICGNVGGTQEIVRPSGGYVCEIDRQYNLEPVDVYHPPPINRTKIVDAMIKCVLEKPRINNAHVSINLVADQYLSFIERLLHNTA